MFKILFVYPNGKLLNPPPVSIGIFTALLKAHGFELALFDTTLYDDFKEKSSDDAKQENLQVRPFSYDERNVTLKTTSLEKDLESMIAEVMPDLVCISSLECTYPLALKMLDIIEKYSVPVIVGGVFATFAPEIILAHNAVTMVCLGEGEDSLVELCLCMRDKKPFDNIKNIWVKKNGKVIKNKLSPPIDINKTPIPDYSLFASERFMRPMGGKVYLTVPIETNRGCPYNCTFCNSPSMAQLYRDSGGGRYFRKKAITKIKEEIAFLVKRWDAEYIYFSSDTFLTLTDKEFDEFIEFYQGIKLPFWIQSRVEAVTLDRMKKLKKVGCHRMSMGLEHGNDLFRKNVLKKNFDNNKMIEATKIIARAEIPLTVNNIIGFPEETRELIFDTIELNRKLIFDTVNATIFAPFHGTCLHKLCVDKGYISVDFTPGSINVEASLDMPQLSKNEIKGLHRTFVMYARMPKSYWPKIARAEKFDEEGNRIFKKLQQIYKEKYFK